MKTILGLVFVWVTTLGFGQSLPVITASPTNITVNPGSTATFSVTATGATGYQWLFNGTNIAGATGATLQVLNAQSTNSGYYSVLVKNATGWTPSQMAWLFLDYTYGGALPTSGGLLPFSNANNTYTLGSIVAYYPGDGSFPTNGYVQVIAGPTLDEMAPVGNILQTRSTPPSNKYTNGYYNTADLIVPTIKPGQAVYYSVKATYTNNGYTYVQPSTIVQLVAGTNGFSAPSCYGLDFPYWIEWPQDPWVDSGAVAIDSSIWLYRNISISTQTRVVGETFSLSNSYTADTDLGMPTFQWRKNGIPLTSAQPFTENYAYYLYPYAWSSPVLTISNAQPSDAGVYDVDVRGNNWFIGQKIYVSIQTTNGGGVFQPARLSGTNLVCNLTGAPGRNYKVQVSTNLLTWNDLTTLTNVTGTVAFTNTASPTGSQFYRTVLLQNY